VRRDDGTATVEFVWLTILLLVPFVYILLAMFDAQRASYAVSAASRSAARAYLAADDPATGEQRARAAARVALADQEVDADIVITCPGPAACLQPGSFVRVVVRTVSPGRSARRHRRRQHPHRAVRHIPGGPAMRNRDEAGTITVVTIGFLLMLGLLTVVVVDSSVAFLERQRLNNLADGAALAAADGLDEARFYTRHRVALDPEQAQRLVGDYLAGEPVRAIGVSTKGDSVTVHLEREIGLALAPPGWQSRTTIVSDATAQLRRSS
jgi:Flp pilus assembly protein TadG